jgi:hypothetical protein
MANVPRGKLKPGGYRELPTTDKGTHVVVVPVGVELRKSMSYFNPEAIPAIVDSAINATSGSTPAIIGFLHPELRDNNNLGVEVVRSVHKAIKKCQPALLELSADNMVTNVEMGPNCLYIVMKPIVKAPKES